MVMPSLGLEPLSVTSEKPIPEGLVVSMAGRLRLLVEVLPAASVKDAVTVIDSVPAKAEALAV